MLRDKSKMKKYKIVLTIIFLSSLLLFFCLFLLPRKEINVQIASGFLPQQQLPFLSSNNLDDLKPALQEYKLFHNLKCEPNIDSPVAEGMIINKNLDNKSVFFQKQIYLEKPIASLTKLMTAVIAWENIDHNKVITLSPTAISSFGDFGDFKEGEQYKLIDLIKGMLVSSSNDAAFALAEQLSLKKFVSLMNEKAETLGMEQTDFVDPNGLSSLNRSTANDLMTLTVYILEKMPEIFSVTKNSRLEIPELKSGKIKVIYNVNKFVENKNFIGGKTGFLLNLEKGSLLSLFNYKDYIVGIVILDGDWTNRYKDTELILSCLP